MGHSAKPEDREKKATVGRFLLEFWDVQQRDSVSTVFPGLGGESSSEEGTFRAGASCSVGHKEHFTYFDLHTVQTGVEGAADSTVSNCVPGTKLDCVQFCMLVVSLRGHWAESLMVHNPDFTV